MGPSPWARRQRPLRLVSQHNKWYLITFHSILPHFIWRDNLRYLRTVVNSAGDGCCLLAQPDRSDKHGRKNGREHEINKGSFRSPVIHVMFRRGTHLGFVVTWNGAILAIWLTFQMCSSVFKDAISLSLSPHESYLVQRGMYSTAGKKMSPKQMTSCAHQRDTETLSTPQHHDVL